MSISGRVVHPRRLVIWHAGQLLPAVTMAVLVAQRTTPGEKNASRRTAQHHPSWVSRVLGWAHDD